MILDKILAAVETRPAELTRRDAVLPQIKGEAVAVIGMRRAGMGFHPVGFLAWLLSIFFVPTNAINIAAFWRGNRRWGAILACCLGIGGMAFLIYLDHYNVPCAGSPLGRAWNAMTRTLAVDSMNTGAPVPRCTPLH